MIHDAKRLQPLLSSNEIICNTIWRFLYLRGYVDKEHQLTTWGRILSVILESLGSSKEQSEAAFVAVELMRLGILNPDTMFPGYNGAPNHGSGILALPMSSPNSRMLCTNSNRHRSTKLFAGFQTCLYWKDAPSCNWLHRSSEPPFTCISYYGKRSSSKPA